MGPLSGLSLPAAGKTHFAAKTPATGGYGDSNMGGHFVVTMKYAGYDVTILTGRAKEPSYLFIDNDTVEIRSGSHLWGKGSTEVEEILKPAWGRNSRF